MHVVKVIEDEIVLGVVSFLVGDLSTYPVPLRSCPRDLAATDHTGAPRLSAYDTRGQPPCITYVRYARDLQLVSVRSTCSAIHRLQDQQKAASRWAPQDVVTRV